MVTHEQYQQALEEQLKAYKTFENTRHDGGPGWAWESAKEKMVLATCKALAIKTEYEKQREEEILQAEMGAWESAQDY